MSTVTATFSEAISPSSLTAATFKLAAGLTPVAGTLSLSASGTTATFTPASRLDGNTVFTATVTSGVKDAAGNALASSTSWSFTTAGAFDLRAAQIAFNSTSLQAYMNATDAGIHTATAQLNAQVVQAADNVLFTLMTESAGSAASNSFGVYNAGGPATTLYQIFPGAAAAGWFAAVLISGGNMSVALFDNRSVLQAQSSYAGVTSASLGFYMQGPDGTSCSQDSRNGGNAQLLTYAATGQHAGGLWECFESSPWASADRDFDDMVILVQSAAPLLPSP